MFSTKKILPVLLCSFLICAMALFLASPAKYAQSVFDGVSLWAITVLPSTFPFLFFTSFLPKLPPFQRVGGVISAPVRRIFHLSRAGGTAMLVSACSGYPVGAKLVYDLKKSNLISKDERFRLACLCSTSSPSFLVGCVGVMMFASAKVGWFLYMSHLLAIWLVGFALSLRATPNDGGFHQQTNENAFSESLEQAVLSILCVGGLIALFSCFQAMLNGLFSLFPPLMQGIFCALLETTTGAKTLSVLNTPLSAALCCGAITFGGLCVLCQQATYLQKAGVNMGKFILVKALQAVLAFFLCLLFCSL